MSADGTRCGPGAGARRGGGWARGSLGARRRRRRLVGGRTGVGSPAGSRKRSTPGGPARSGSAWWWRWRSWWPPSSQRCRVLTRGRPTVPCCSWAPGGPRGARRGPRRHRASSACCPRSRPAAVRSMRPSPSWPNRGRIATGWHVPVRVTERRRRPHAGTCGVTLRRRRVGGPAARGPAAERSAAAGPTRRPRGRCRRAGTGGGWRSSTSPPCSTSDRWPTPAIAGWLARVERARPRRARREAATRAAPGRRRRAARRPGDRRHPAAAGGGPGARWRRPRMTHLTAVSGMHVASVVAGVLGLCALVRAGARTRRIAVGAVVLVVRVPDPLPALGAAGGVGRAAWCSWPRTAGSCATAGTRWRARSCCSCWSTRCSPDRSGCCCRRRRRPACWSSRRGCATGWPVSGGCRVASPTCWR